MPFKEIFVVYSETHMKLINIQWRVTCKYTEENYKVAQRYIELGLVINGLKISLVV
jgi:hypothetical protein